MRTFMLTAALLLAGCASPLDAHVQRIHGLKVQQAMDAYEQTPPTAQVDRCVKAKLVALAYEDASDRTSASAWHARERADCQAAMASMGVTPPAPSAD